MLDIIPHSAKATRGGPSGRSRGKPSKNILKVAWKLPARLRKPIRQQLVAERKLKRGRILQGFHRRPLTTQRLTSEVAAGVERHTGDIYRESAPQLRLIAPPYVGPVMKGALHRGSPVTPRLRPELPVAGGVTQELFDYAQDSSPKIIAEPQRKLRLPFSIDWLTPLRPAGAGLPSFEENVKEGKKKVPFGSLNLSLLLAGCFLAAGLVWNLQGAGQGWKVLASVKHQAQQAAARLTSAQLALAEADFIQSEIAFADAEAIITATRNELDSALSTSRHALELLDVTGTVRSGEALLRGGESLTQAGQHVSRGLKALLSAKVLPEEEGEQASSSLVQAILAARSEFAQAQTLLVDAESKLSVVRGGLLPTEVQADVDRLAQILPQVRSLLEQFDEQADAFLKLLGNERGQEYLLLFANNHELRPVGGFIGSLGLISVDQGVVEEIDVKTVYDGDGQLKEFIAPPDPLTTVVNRWYLRDSNWFVDYAVSASKAAQFFEKEGGQTVDGVILLTPDVMQDLIRVAGPISVPGYDTVVTADNFTEVTQREVTYEYDRAVNRPKQFLADLTPILLNKLFQSEHTQALSLLSALTRNLAEKNVLLFFRDEELQQRVVELGWGGTLPKDASAFLMVNNANIGGHKSDQFIDQEVDYRLEVGNDGVVQAVVTIRRTHRGPAEGSDFPYEPWENPALKDNIVYQRVLVPEGAKLLEAQGFTPASTIPRLVKPEAGVQLSADPDLAEWQRGQVQHSSGTAVGREAGYTFFANWIVTVSGQTTVALLRYQLPGRIKMPGVIDEASRVSAYIAKQPGERRTTVRVSMRLPEGSEVIAHIPESGITPISKRELAYRGGLTRDLVLGAVFERR